MGTPLERQHLQRTVLAIRLRRIVIHTATPQEWQDLPPTISATRVLNIQTLTVAL